MPRVVATALAFAALSVATGVGTGLALSRPSWTRSAERWLNGNVVAATTVARPTKRSQVVLVGQDGHVDSPSGGTDHRSGTAQPPPLVPPRRHFAANGQYVGTVQLAEQRIYKPGPNDTFDSHCRIEADDQGIACSPHLTVSLPYGYCVDFASSDGWRVDGSTGELLYVRNGQVETGDRYVCDPSAYAQAVLTQTLPVSPPPAPTIDVPSIPQYAGVPTYPVACNDGQLSLSGGHPGACSWHSGIAGP